MIDTPKTVDEAHANTHEALVDAIEAHAKVLIMLGKEIARLDKRIDDIEKEAK